jgi:histone acetyltransferase
MGKTLFYDIEISNSFNKKKKKIRQFFFKNSQNISCLNNWKILKKKEINQEMAFKIHENNGLKRNFKTLWLLKRLFQKQLPNIPKTYIARILYDKNHQSLILKRYKNKKSQIIGGCSFRLFRRQQLIELVFFSIETKKQTKGYGSFLITLLKDYSRFMGFKHIITCADNNAVNFFFNQGFSPIITLPTIFWTGFLKDYEDVVLMEFTVQSKVNFVNSCYMLFFLIDFPLFHSRWKKNNVIKSLGFRKKINSRTKAFFFSKKISEYKKCKKLYEEIYKFFNKLKFNNFIFPFLEPNREDIFFDKNIFKKIYNGMDLRTIEEKIRFEFYISWDLFLKDFRRIVGNFQLYNGEKHIISENLGNLQLFLKNNLPELSFPYQ